MEAFDCKVKHGAAKQTGSERRWQISQRLDRDQVGPAKVGARRLGSYMLHTFPEEMAC